MSPDLSISIINTANAGQTLDCLHSLEPATAHLSLEIFVLDNASGDGSAERIAASFPCVHVIRNETRAGFATNNNIVLSMCTGRYALLLNDDTLVQPGALEALVTYMDEHPDVGITGAALLNSDGTSQRSFDIFPTPLYEAFRPLSHVWRGYPHTPHAPIAVDSVSGACMLVRREILSQVGMLDPAFDPLYSEEVDWCYRIKQAGWQVYHVPQARVVHLGSQTMNRQPLQRVDRLYAKKVRFFSKHGSRATVWSFKVLLFATTLMKLGCCLLLGVLGRPVAPKLQMHWHIARRVWSW